MSYPKTKEEWWQTVYNNKHDLLKCISMFHPVMEKFHRMTITAPTAEVVCEAIRGEIKQESSGDPVLLAEKYIEEQDPRFASILNETWYGAPESRSVMSVPGFGVLCDLCSENYLLREDEEDVDCA